MFEQIYKLSQLCLLCINFFSNKGHFFYKKNCPIIFCERLAIKFMFYFFKFQNHDSCNYILKFIQLKFIDIVTNL